MATDSKIILPKETDLLCQGDIFKDVKYSFIDHEDNEHVEIIEFTFPYAIIISQACDVISMSEMLENNNLHSRLSVTRAGQRPSVCTVRFAS
jgi:hypothetical protein